jgi:hypothetical protein
MRAGIDTYANGAGGAVGDDVDHLAVRLRPRALTVEKYRRPAGPPRMELLCPYGVSCPSMTR